MRGFVPIMAVCIVFSLSACEALIFERGNGEMVINRQEVDDFTKISIEGNFEVFLNHSEEPSVVMKIDENLQQFMEVENRGNTLHIRTTENIRSDDGIKIFIGFNELRQVACGGSSSIYTEVPIEGKSLVLSMSGAGIMEMDVVVENLDVSLSGAGMLSLRGASDWLGLSMSGAGSFDGKYLETNDAKVTISGVGGAKVHVRNELEATVSGVGGVEYTGNPTNIVEHVSGIGTVMSAD